MKTPAAKCTDKRALGLRSHHDLNDRLVTLREGATGKSVFAQGANLLGGGGHQGYVWVVAGAKAMVDFGTIDGHAIRVIADPADLLVVG